MSDTTDQTNLINHNDNQTATSASSNDNNDNSQGLTVPNKKTIKARSTTVDFNNVGDPSFSIDIDAFDREFLNEEFEDDIL
nr:10162_t:CDS:2 [Entrophospora candida]CAG8619402.1 6007_t:CDS:2 [Entrophospora candida]